MSKKLYINTGSAMILKDEHSTLGNYDKIIMNAGSLIISTKILADLKEENVQFTYNTGSTTYIDVDGEILALNNKSTIDENTDVENKVVVCDGTIIVASTAKENIKKIKSIYTEKIFLPKNISVGEIPNLNAEKIITYDSDAIIMFGNKDIDSNSSKYFLPNTSYYIDGMVTIFNKDGADYLKNNNIKIECKSLKIYEDVLNILSGTVKSEKIETIPHGYKYLSGGDFDESTIYQHGKKVYVGGNLKIDKKFKDELKKFESIIVMGELAIEKNVLEDFFRVGSAESVYTYEGKLVQINGKIDLSHEFFTPFMEHGGRITVNVNGILSIADDVVKEDLACISKIKVNGNIHCTDTVKAYLMDIIDGHYTFSNDKKDDDAINNIISAFNDPDNEVINTGSYTLI